MGDDVRSSPTALETLAGLTKALPGLIALGAVEVVVGSVRVTLRHVAPTAADKPEPAPVQSLDDLLFLASEGPKGEP